MAIRLSLQARLLLLTALALTPALAILVYNEVSLRSAREAEVHELALRFGQLAAQELEGIVGGVESVLRTAARAPVTRSFDTEPCRSFLSDVQAQSPNLTTLTVIDLEGRVRCRHDMPTSASLLADRPYFKNAIATGGFVVGEYTVSRISGQAGLVMATPIKDETGTIVGVLATGLDLAWLGQRLRGRDLIRGGALTIADRSGIIIAREPQSEQFVGSRIPDMFMPLVQGKNSGSREVLSQDGTRRIIGYVPPAANTAGVYVSAGLSENEAFAPIDRAARRGAALAVTGALLAFLVAWLLGRNMLGRPVQRLVGTISAWRAGDQTIRTGMNARQGELETVGAAIDRFMDELSQRQERQQLLINELNHRVKNTLATVQSIALHTFRGDNSAASSRATFESRLMALSKAQEVLTRENWEGADLEEIVREAVEPHCGDDRARVEVKGPKVTLPPRMALSLAMALHELCTNAAKYGGFSTRRGSVFVEWLLVVEGDEQRLRLSWRESGGPAVVPPNRRGFGSRLIEQGMARELNGEARVDYAPGGVVCTIDVPLAEASSRPLAPTVDEDSERQRQRG
ncbi:MAG TPA: sensor histidine kinase [Microvirga sp.]